MRWDLYVRRLQNSGWDDLLEKGMRSIEVVGRAVARPNPFNVAEALLAVARTMTGDDLYFYDVLDRNGWKRVFPSCVKDQLLEILEPHITSRIKVNTSGNTTVVLISKAGVRIGWVKENDENTTTDILAHVDHYDESVKFVRDLLWSTVDASRIVLSAAEKNYDTTSKNQSNSSNGQVRVVTDDLIDSVNSPLADTWVSDLRAYAKHNVKRTILFHGPAGCHAKGQLIMMSDGSLKCVEDIVIGDRLAGPSGTPRNVLELKRGHGDMVRIIPVKGQPFIVNKEHILTLAKNNRVFHKRSKNRPDFGALNHYELIDITVRDWLMWSKAQKKMHKLVRSDVVTFENQVDVNCIDPYVLGALIGDGAIKNGVRICSMDNEIVNAFREFSEHSGLRLVPVLAATNGKAKTYGVTFMKGHENWLLSEIRRLKLNIGSGEKFVPTNYKCGSVETRRQILAGLIDTDGHLDKGGCFDFCSKSKCLADDIVFLARSLGLAAYTVACSKRATNSREKKFEIYHRVCISGDLSIIPTRVKRKQASLRCQRKNVRMTGFYVEEIGRDDYYGFTLDADGRYLLDDFTITHNSGKSTLARTICEKIGVRSLRVRVEDISSLGTQSVGEIISIFEPDAIIFDDLDRSASQLALFEMMEMLHQRVSFVFATVNHLSSLADALKRPGRFDDVVYVSRLDENAMRKLLGEYADDAYDIVKDWPVAFVKEYIVRRHVLGAARALSSIKELQVRVKELMENYGEEGPAPDYEPEEESD